MRIADDIRPVVGAISKVAESSVRIVVVREQRYRERLPRLERQHTKTLPASQPAMTGCDRQIVSVANRQALPDVEIGPAPLRAQIIAVLRKIRIARGGEKSRSVI